MLFDLFRKAELHQCSPEEWRRQWQSLVPPENRNVPITYEGRTEIAFIQMNHYVMMLQDGLLMESTFFDVCELFQKAGYHVIWLMRCTQDIHNGYLKLVENDNGRRCRWLWKSPTTNFGRGPRTTSTPPSFCSGGKSRKPVWKTALSGCSSG